MNNANNTAALITLAISITIQKTLKWMTESTASENIGMALTSIAIINILILPKENNNNSAELIVSIIVATSIVVFTTSSMLNLFIAFEAAIVPTILLITKWGDYPERSTATIFIIIITMLGSLPIIAVLPKLSFSANESTNTINVNLTEKEENLWLCMSVIFLVNLPMYSVHMWLPKAHVQAPAIGSIILAGVILKLGGYGANNIITFKQANDNNIITSISIISAITIAVTSVRQSDNKTTVAYSSVSHMIVILANIASSINTSENTTSLAIIAHGLVSPILFLQAGNTISTQNSNNTLTSNTVKLESTSTIVTIIIFLANISTPPSLNFMIEFEIIMNVINNNSNNVIALAILTMSMLCIMIATTFSQGNKNNNISTTSDNSTDFTSLISVILAVALTLTTIKIQ